MVHVRFPEPGNGGMSTSSIQAFKTFQSGLQPILLALAYLFSINFAGLSSIRNASIVANASAIGTSKYRLSFITVSFAGIKGTKKAATQANFTEEQRKITS